MIPVRDAVPAPTRPAVTLVLIATFVLAAMLLPIGFVGSVSGPTGAQPIVRSAATLLSLFRPPAWMPLAAGAFAIWIFGPTVEDRVGHRRFLALYILSGAFAAAVTAIGSSTPDALIATGGTSAAVAGIVGAHLALYPRGRVLVLVPCSAGLDVADVPSWLIVIYWLLATVVAVAVAGAHIPGGSLASAVSQIAIGAIAGAASVHVLKRPERMKVNWWG